ncbi:MAG: hypothetical protein K5780_05285 [Alphaproteobacteria bacterium]|nr:hypothetical protein [Alphaproteobacteria bacterium]
MKKIIFGLVVCITLSNFESNANVNQFEKPATGSEVNTRMSTSLKIKELISRLIKVKNLLLNMKLQVNDNQYLNDPIFVEFKRNLISLSKVVQNPRVHLNTILGKGDKIFSDSNNQLFSSKSIPSDLKASYSDALNTWKEIRYEANSNEKLDDFRKKIELLVNISQPNPN